MKRALLIITILIIGIYLIINRSNSNIEPIIEKEKPHKYQEIFNILNTKEINLKEFTIYGKHFNIKIENLLENNLIEPKLVLKNNEEEIIYNLIKEDNIYKTNNKINEGINLEEIKESNYLLLIKDNEIYYNIKNNTKYKDLIYYQLSVNNNNKITIDFISHKENHYMQLDCSKNQNEEIYDITIDPGHGGVDSGAVNGNIYEKTQNLNTSKEIKKELESLGYKVKLTRETNNDEIDTYGVGSRVEIPYEVKSKLHLAVHMNAGTKIMRGIELYTPYNIDYSFIKNMATKLVNNTSFKYSLASQNKKANGVYTRLLTKQDLDAIKKQGKEKNFEPYNVYPNTTYYYFIRETGGIITHAYVDGRNKDYNPNTQMLSNHGIESYLLELGYISNNNDINIVTNERTKIAKAIASSVDEYLKNKIV